MQSTQTKKAAPDDLAKLYATVRARTEEICAPLTTEDFLPQPADFVSPPKWNVAHTSWFFEEMILKRFAAGYKVFDENFAFLFNSYYNSVGARTVRHKRGDLARPTVSEVFEYRRYVDEKMRALFENDLPVEVREIVILGLHHEQQHQELLLSDLKYIFACNPTFPVYDAENILEERSEIINRDYAEIAGGIYEIGFTGEGFHFDNELGRHKVFLEDFSICRNLVTNGEFLEFVEDGGYKNFRFWHAEGFDWAQENQIDAPLYWHKQDGEWMNFTLGGLRKIKRDAPVAHVSFYEAAAFAEWKGARLPTEFEWETANAKFDWGLRWEWTNSAYLPYPKFSKAAGALGEYNGKFMVNQMVLRGASIATPLNHSRPTYRNFFHAPLRWQFTGIRLAR